MSLAEVMKQGFERYGVPKKAERLKKDTPLKHYLRPIIEEAARARMQNLPQMNEGTEQAVEPPSTNPLLNTLLSGNQSGVGGGLPNSQGGGEMVE